MALTWQDSASFVIPAAVKVCSHEGGDLPEYALYSLDSRFRGNDVEGLCGDPWCNFSAALLV
jgi:hypothetical protein